MSYNPPTNNTRPPLPSFSSSIIKTIVEAEIQRKKQEIYRNYAEMYKNRGLFSEAYDANGLIAAEDCGEWVDRLYRLFYVD